MLICFAPLLFCAISATSSRPSTYPFMRESSMACGNEMVSREKKDPVVYCVTGATGYIGSWLVKSLLARGYTVHATVRDLAKVSHFESVWKGGDRLKLFKADLHEENSFDEAVSGCHGVFHVAASMEFNISNKHDIEHYVQSSIIEPAVKGVLNILKSCLKSNTVKRVVLTSSISTMTAKDALGNWKNSVDESCKASIDAVWSTKASGWVYALSKILADEAAFQFAKENNFDLVSVITTTVAGPALTPTVPASIQVLLSPITGDSNVFQILSAVNSRMGSIGIVHIDDICNAHIFLMENPKAEEDYICCACNSQISELISHFAAVYPNTKTYRVPKEECHTVPDISSKKLSDLGFTYIHGLQDIVRDAVYLCKDNGFLCQNDQSKDSV